MRIAFCSDLHADVTPQNRALVPLLAEEVARRSPEVLVLAGDCANTLAVLEEVLAAFRVTAPRLLFVPGNHDLWIESNKGLRRGQDSWRKYTEAIPEVCARQGFVSLPGHPFVQDGVGFVGSVGWYDYSLADPRLAGIVCEPEYDRGEFEYPPGRPTIWSDTRNAVWLRDGRAPDWRERQHRLRPPSVFGRIFEQWEKDVAAVDSAGSLVCVLHTSPFAECLERKPLPDPFDAYEGSARLGEVLAREAGRGRRVTCIAGHRHRVLEMEVRGVRVLRSPVGYLLEPVDLGAVARSAVGVVEVA